MSHSQAIVHVTPMQRSGVKVSRREEKFPVIDGYAAVFYRADDPGTVYQLWEDFHERIMPGAFDRAIKEAHDARGLFNHDRNMLLGRVSSGTLRLSVDAIGLKYEIDAADTQAGRDTVTSIDRGDLSGSSFAFIPSRTVWVEEGDILIRQVEDLDLYDVGPVTFPAYQSTTTSLRSAQREEVEREVAEWRASRVTPDEIAVRQRMVQLGEGG